MSFVADASVGVAWIAEAQATAATDALLEKVGEGHRIVVPCLWPFEVSNALLMLLRRKRLEQQDYLDAVGLLGGLRAAVDEDGIRLAKREVPELARAHGLTVYDGAYLELALRRKLPLASRDSDLNRAARNCGVEVLL